MVRNWRQYSDVVDCERDISENKIQEGGGLSCTEEVGGAVEDHLGKAIVIQERLQRSGFYRCGVRWKPFPRTSIEITQKIYGGSSVHNPGNMRLKGLQKSRRWLTWGTITAEKETGTITMKQFDTANLDISHTRFQVKAASKFNMGLNKEGDSTSPGDCRTGTVSSNNVEIYYVGGWE